jgi:hypothetical protein
MSSGLRLRRQLAPTRNSRPVNTMAQIKDRFERALPSDFVPFEDEELRYVLSGPHLHCTIALESGDPVIPDAWAVRLEVHAPTPLRPGVAPESLEIWIDAGIKGRSLIDFNYTGIDGRDYWDDGEFDGLLTCISVFAVPWLRQIQTLRETRAFYERAFSSKPEPSIDQLLDDSEIIKLYAKSKHKLLLNMNLGLICYWQNDYENAWHYLSSYRDELVRRFERVKNLRVHQLNVDRLKLTQDLLDELSALRNS